MLKEVLQMLLKFYKLFFILFLCFVMPLMECYAFDNCSFEIKKARKLLSDKESKKVFDAALEFYASPNGNKAPNYFVKYYSGENPRVHPREGDYVIDAGISGDTFDTEIMLNHVGKKGKVFGIEANSKLINLIKYKLEKYNNFYLYNYALYNYDGIGKFDLGITPDDPLNYLGRIPIDNYYNTNNFIEIKYITLDSFIKENNIEKVDYIKMDIEHAELKALEGSMKTIKTFLPDLSISVHSIDNLYKAILFIHSLNKQYKFYLVQYNKKECWSSDPQFRWRDYELNATVRNK